MTSYYNFNENVFRSDGKFNGGSLLCIDNKHSSNELMFHKNGSCDTNIAFRLMFHGS
jgi:hypothetical protein